MNVLPWPTAFLDVARGTSKRIDWGLDAKERWRKGLEPILQEQDRLEAYATGWLGKSGLQVYNPTVVASSDEFRMPWMIRELDVELKAAGFEIRDAKRSHELATE